MISRGIPLRGYTGHAMQLHATYALSAHHVRLGFNTYNFVLYMIAVEMRYLW